MHLYLHVPFCVRRCSYCDFAIAVRRHDPSREYLAAVRGELDLVGRTPWWEDVGPVETIYFGGGTPSRLDPAVVAALLGDLAGRFRLAEQPEVTLEANPEDVSSERAAAWLAAGVNRVSLGVQSFDPGALRWMHRAHDGDRAVEAMAGLRAAGIGNLSIDLIYGLPAELGRSWSDDLDRALALEPDHLSLYGLTVEPRTPLGRWVDRGTVTSVADEVAAREYLAAHQALVDRGWQHYEVSNAARPGRESRHNRAYWLRRPYLGLGPSAHSAHLDRRWWNVPAWAAYRRRAGSAASLIEAEERLTESQIRLEGLYLGLRTRDGVPASTLPAETVTQWLAAGWAGLVGSRIVLTAEGWLVLDGLVRQVDVT